MNPEALIPIGFFMMPVAIVFIVFHYRLKSREIEADLEARRLADQGALAQVNARLDRLESVILAASQIGAVGRAADRQLYEAPPLPEELASSPVSTGRRDPLR